MPFLMRTATSWPASGSFLASRYLDAKSVRRSQSHASSEDVIRKDGEACIPKEQRMEPPGEPGGLEGGKMGAPEEAPV